ncbi:unnamed protein product [Prorocentrum cordatum]|uniref:Uncharacterized protein n=1 Tax=Prorocentrum cordatum TaxID=2364126 RepID=A0ABN9T1L7_9DINO|nr:unnamed protein product [Polarella glacialis]
MSQEERSSEESRGRGSRQARGAQLRTRIHKSGLEVGSPARRAGSGAMWARARSAQSPLPRRASSGAAGDRSRMERADDDDDDDDHALGGSDTEQLFLSTNGMLSVLSSLFSVRPSLPEPPAGEPFDADSNLSASSCASVTHGGALA